MLWRMRAMRKRRMLGAQLEGAQTLNPKPCVTLCNACAMNAQGAASKPQLYRSWFLNMVEAADHATPID